MKATRYLAIVLALVAILATVGWFLRDSLVQRFSTPLLAEYDLVITDVSLDTFAFFDNDSSVLDVTIGYLELQHANGTTIAIEGLTLPVRAVANRLKRYAARRVSITAKGSANDEPPEIARYLAKFLSLPEVMPGNDIHIDELRLATYPVITDLTWQLSDEAQEIAFHLDAIDLVLSSARRDPVTHEILVELLTPASGVTPPVVRTETRQSESNIAVTGQVTLDLPEWTAFLVSSGMVSNELDVASGVVDLQFDTEIPYDTSQQYAISATVTPTTPIQLGLRDSSGMAIAEIATDRSPLSISVTLPVLHWTVTQEQSSLVVSYDDWRDVQIAISELSCNSARTCTMQTGIGIENAELPIGQTKKFELISKQEVNYSGNEIIVNVEPGATWTIAGWSVDSFAVNTVAATVSSAMKVELSDAGWVLVADSIDANVDRLVPTGDFSVTAPVYFEKTTVRQLQETLSFDTGIFLPKIDARLGDQAISAPGIKGTVALGKSAVDAQLTTVGLQQDGAIDAKYSLESGQGELSIKDASVSFARQKLSDLIRPWRRNWNVAAGTLALSLESKWDDSGADLSIAGSASARLAGLGGYYSDIAFTGLSTELVFGYDADTGLSVEPATIEIALLDVGLPIENISAAVIPRFDDLSARFESLQMNAFGGVVRADPFSFHTASDSNNLTLHAESIELSDLLSIKEFEAIEVTGSIRADLPVTVYEDGVMIVDGKLTGVPPGGVIRYRPAAGADPVASSIGIVTAALSNFEYESLTSDVSYSKDGDLKLKMQLKGRNPDLQEKRPVVLNLGVENNVPQMLKSLQAARSVEDILERRMAK